MGVQLIGVTGAPGVGKSTATAALIAEYRAAGRRIGVVAVDPTSPRTGGALLGDRIRMQRHGLDDGVFIRSMASRSELGGLAPATPEVARIIAASGFDPVIVETVGVGQGEVEVVSCCDTVAVLCTAGLGDAVQAAKAGVLEIADVFVVSKSDLPGAGRVRDELLQMLEIGEVGADSYRPPVIELRALSGEGTVALVDELARHWAWLQTGDRLHAARLSKARARLVARATGQLLRRVVESGVLDALAARVASGELAVGRAAEVLSRTP